MTFDITEPRWCLYLKNLILFLLIFRKCPRNVWKRSPYLRDNYRKSSEIFEKWSEIFRKLSKTLSLVCLCNKQNITCPLVDMNFILECSTRHLTHLLRSLMRYRVEHSKDHVYLRHLSADCRSILSADMATDTRPIYRPTLGRYVGRVSVECRST